MAYTREDFEEAGFARCISLDAPFGNKELTKFKVYPIERVEWDGGNLWIDVKGVSLTHFARYFIPATYQEFLTWKEDLEKWQMMETLK